MSFSAGNIDVFYGTQNKSVNPERSMLHTGDRFMREGIRAFFDAELKGIGDTNAYLSEFASSERAAELSVQIDHKTAQPAPPVGDAFVELVRKEGIEEGWKVFRRARELDPNIELFGDRAISDIGAQWYPAGKVKDAIRCVELQLASHPTSHRAMTDLSFVFEQEGRIAEAVGMLTRLLEVYPDDERANRRISMLNSKMDADGSDGK